VASKRQSGNGRKQESGTSRQRLFLRDWGPHGHFGRQFESTELLDRVSTTRLVSGRDFSRAEKGLKYKGF
jgi:hypothetical protein